MNPLGVKLVMEAVCIMKNLKPTRVKAKDGRMMDDFWETSKKMVSDTQFLKSLKDYDKDNMDPAIIKRLKAYVENPAFDPKVIKKVSVAAYGLCCWSRAMYKYDAVAKVVKPKRIALQGAQEELVTVMAALKVKQDALQEVVDKLEKLDQGLQVTANRKKKKKNGKKKSWEKIKVWKK
jgi:dynein heavy chain